jgi:hypothetical protein
MPCASRHGRKGKTSPVESTRGGGFFGFDFTFRGRGCWSLAEIGQRLLPRLQEFLVCALRLTRSDVGPGLNDSECDTCRSLGLNAHLFELIRDHVPEEASVNIVRIGVPLALVEQFKQLMAVNVPWRMVLRFGVILIVLA